MINKLKKPEPHMYKVINNVGNLISTVFPTVTMEMNDEATLEDHIYAFERFLQSIGHVLPENAHLDFVENDIESDRDEEIIIQDPSNHKNNGTN